MKLEECKFPDHFYSRPCSGRYSVVFGGSLPQIGANCQLFSISVRTLGMKRQQSSLGKQQIGQAEQREELCRHLGEFLETLLLQAEDILDVVEQMLTDSSGTCFGFLNGFEQCADGVSGIEVLKLDRHHGHLPVHRHVLGFWPLVDTKVS